jgi:hypothetical protein
MQIGCMISGNVGLIVNAWEVDFQGFKTYDEHDQAKGKAH